MPDQETPKDEDEARLTAWAASGKYAGLGLQLAASIGLFLFLGWKLDQRLGVTPLLTIIGAFVGAGAGFYSLYRHVILDTQSGAEKDQ